MVVGEGGTDVVVVLEPVPGNGRRVRLESGGRERSMVVVVELAVEDCEGGRRVVVPVRAVAVDLARVWRDPAGAGARP